MASVLTGPPPLDEPEELLLMLPPLLVFNTANEPGPSFEPDFCCKLETLADFTKGLIFDGDLNELLNLLARLLVDLGGLDERGLRLWKPPVIPEFTADCTISLIVLSILPLLHIELLRLVFVSLGLLLFTALHSALLLVLEFTTFATA